jgi:predicted ArsR family transcriptional regulator
MRFRLSERVVGENLGMLASALLDLTSTNLRHDSDEAVMSALTRALVQQLSDPAIEATGRARLAALAGRLSALHYQAHWEAGALGPRLIFGNCPYATVIAKHPALCQMDRRAISALVGTEARQEAKIDPRGKGPSRCVFWLE